MLIDTSGAIERNRELLQASAWAMENVALGNAAINILRASCDLDLKSDDHVTVLRLAIRLINTAGAAGDALMSGYYQPTAALIRDLIEVGFLIDLFRREPKKVAEWRLGDRSLRKKGFSAFELRKALNRLDGSTENKRDEAYQYFTSHGTHVDPDAIALTSPNRMTFVGPFPDRDRLVGLSFDLARYLAAATEYFIHWLLLQQSGAGPKVDIVAGHIDRFREACNDMATRQTDPQA
ncbi:hypothetical protein OOJ09_03565 [Mesorhizobium qingshengii]|uniref:HEPN AbiU2-like domain-containing protein n=1 Tax=Mesorhizobium qingshengii TaxID=1165689 RepID=A0ABT4QNX3_9HYPH|nr:hypothetical protein [Mesorhizobium qingshengii]MCZ8543244.1 hypothetical protein [Mesorhizobium qingshengii]